VLQRAALGGRPHRWPRGAQRRGPEAASTGASRAACRSRPSSRLGSTSSRSRCRTPGTGGASARLSSADLRSGRWLARSAGRGWSEAVPVPRCRRRRSPGASVRGAGGRLALERARPGAARAAAVAASLPLLRRRFELAPERRLVRRRLTLAWVTLALRPVHAALADGLRLPTAHQVHRLRPPARRDPARQRGLADVPGAPLLRALGAARGSPARAGVTGGHAAGSARDSDGLRRLAGRAVSSRRPRRLPGPPRAPGHGRGRRRAPADEPLRLPESRQRALAALASRSPSWSLEAVAQPRLAVAAAPAALGAILASACSAR
jgi:hypothetical protein